MTSAATSPDAQMHEESFSRSQASGKSRYSFRLYFFTFLSVVACALALANVASAATPSGEDQYLEQQPSGGGDTGGNDVDVVDTNNDGVITEAEVKAAAEKQKKKAEKKAKDTKDDEGATGATGGAAGTTPTPPAAQSVATAAKIGPFSRNTALILGALALLIGLGAYVFGGAGSGLFGLGASSSGAPPPAQ